jgi:adenine-specific DNA-methyltransferase
MLVGTSYSASRLSHTDNIIYAKGQTTPSSIDASVVNWHGDCYDLLDEIPDDSISLTFTSPRFDIKKSYESSKQDLQNWIKEQTGFVEKIVQKTKPGGHLVWDLGMWVSGTGRNSQVIPLDAFIVQIFLDQGLQIRNRIVWEYPHGPECKHRFTGKHNTAIWAVKPGADYHFDLDSVRVPQKYPGKRYSKGSKKGKLSGNPLGKNPGDVWKISNVKSSHPEKQMQNGAAVHPCQFPIAYAEQFVLALTEPEDLVFDPFSGLGSTALAAVKNGRRGWCSDLVKDYVEVAQRRFGELIDGKLPYNPMKGEVEVNTQDKRSQVPLEWAQNPSVIPDMDSTGGLSN